MTEQQIEIASRTIAEIVHEAATGREKLSPEALVKVAEDAASAIVAGFEKLRSAKSCS